MHGELQQIEIFIAMPNNKAAVNKLLKRVAVAAGSALGLVAVSAVFAAFFGA